MQASAPGRGNGGGGGIGGGWRVEEATAERRVALDERATPLEDGKRQYRLLRPVQHIEPRGRLKMPPPFDATRAREACNRNLDHSSERARKTLAGRSASELDTGRHTGARAQTPVGREHVWQRGCSR